MQVKHNVISTGSKGNAVIYSESILLDCGVSYIKLRRYVNKLQIVLLTHEHKDHLNIRTLKRLQAERPTLRIGCGKWMLPLLNGLNNIDVYEVGKIYNYGTFKVSIGKLYHDVPNCFYRLFVGEYKIFHATDTAHLKGITAKGYDLYAIEHNYDEEKAQQAIEIAKETGEYCHAIGSINSHLSIEQAWEFINKNKKENSETVRLHQSSTYY